MTTATVSRFADCPDTLTEEQLNLYFEQGYIAFENALAPEEVETARADISEIIRRYAFNEELADYTPPRKNGTNYAGATFIKKGGRCGFWLESEYDPQADKIDELELNVRKLMWFENETPKFRHLVFEHPKLQGVVRSILGGAPLLYQTMGLIKPPLIGAEKPWHQDNAYFSITDLNKICGVWVALDDATVENGCMHVIPGGHKLGPLRHHHTFDCEIVEGRIDKTQAAPVELKAGGAMFFTGMTPHETPPNRSNERRRAVQFHYRTEDNAVIPKEAYYEVFKEADGTPASCAAARQVNF